MKKLYFFLAALCCMLFTAAPKAWAETKYWDLNGFVWAQYEDGTLTIGGADEEEGYTYIPLDFDEGTGDPIIEWAEYLGKIKKIVVHSGFKSLCYYAFANSAVTEVQLPNGLVNIDTYAFYNCVSLTEITLPESTKKIDNAAFAECTSLVSVTCLAIIPPELAWISPFDEKDMELTVPKGCKDAYEESNWKKYFKTIKEDGGMIVEPDDEKTVEGVVYQRFGENWTVSKVTDEAPSRLSLKAEIDGKPVTKIAKKAMYGNTKVEHLDIPSSVTDIDKAACGNCKIKYLGWNVKKLSGEFSASFFKDCDKLYSVTFGDEVKEIPDYFCNEVASLEDVTFSQAVNLEKIGESAFYKTGITSLDLRATNGVSIAPSAFARCTQLQSAYLAGDGDKDGVTVIGICAFQECTSLWMVDLSTKTSLIGDAAFKGCDISSIVFNGVDEISMAAFANQSSPMSITIKSRLPIIDEDAFEGTTIGKMRVDCSLETAYKAAVNWMAIASSPEFTLMAANLDENMIAILPDYAQADNCTFSITKTPTCADPVYEIEPLPAEGYVFIGWEGQECTVSKLTINAKDIKSGSIAATARFQKTDRFNIKIAAKTSPEDIGGVKAYVCKDTPRPENAYEKGETAVFKAEDAKGWATFRGWDHNADRFNPYVVINKETVSFEVVTEGEDATPTEVTAVYKYNDIDVSVQVKATGTGEVKASADKAKLGGKVTLTATEDKTQKFLHWKDRYGNIVSTNAETEVEITPACLYALYKDGKTEAELYSTGELRPYSDFETDYTLVAGYTAVFTEAMTYKVTLVAENGKISVTEPGIDLEHVLKGTVLHLTAVADDGYKFEGWTNYDGKTGLAVTSDTTVTATFKLKTYTVTFVDYDGTELKTETVEHGKDATAPADPEREGYEFTGWDNTFTNVISDLNVQAQYKKKDATAIGETDIQNPQTDTRKFFRNGILYIIRNGRLYDSEGRLCVNEK
ncbi:MAG: leucine-rich repeat protein [Paludibacteraceae bacterium]|nr:leucine-rich repeat protein [Paludibacteraceae bacterium]